jgi:hypothetical protein
MIAYVYIWFRPDWTPFYVGIGKSPSRWNPERAKPRDRNSYCIRIIEKYGAKNIHVQLHRGLTWAEACKKEQSLIAHFGRFDSGGLLANFTDGGEGALNPAPHVRSASRDRLLDPNNPMRKTHLILNSDANIAKRRQETLKTDRIRTLRTEAANKRWKDPKTREALSEKMRIIWAERRAKNPPKAPPKRMTPEELSLHRSNMLKARNADPEYQAKRIAALKAASEKISAGVVRAQPKRLATLATPEVQAKLRRPKTAEHNRKVSEAKKLWWVERKKNPA